MLQRDSRDDIARQRESQAHRPRRASCHQPSPATVTTASSPAIDIVLPETVSEENGEIW
jgi:hypothetical protein